MYVWFHGKTHISSSAMSDIPPPTPRTHTHTPFCPQHFSHLFSIRRGIQKGAFYPHHPAVYLNFRINVVQLKFPSFKFTRFTSHNSGGTTESRLRQTTLASGWNNAKCTLYYFAHILERIPYISATVGNLSYHLHSSDCYVRDFPVRNRHLSSKKIYLNYCIPM